MMLKETMLFIALNAKEKKYVSKHDFGIIMKKQEIDREYDENDNARSR